MHSQSVLSKYGLATCHVENNESSYIIVIFVKKLMSSKDFNFV